MKFNSLTIFFPCYNDAETIGSLVATADIVARRLVDDYEIIVIDDASKDTSREIITELKNIYPKLKAIFHEENKGYGGALRSGFQNATKDLIFYTDGDGQYDVYELEYMYNAMHDGIDVVNGYKIERNDPLYRIIIGRIYLFLMRIIFRFKIRDVDCDFRLIKSNRIKNITLKHNSGVICLEMIKKLEKSGAIFIEYPVNHYFRAYGKSQFFKFKRLYRVIINIIRLWFELRKEPGNNNKKPILTNPSLRKIND